MFDNCLTSSVQLKQPNELTGFFMKEQTVNTREFLRNYKKFSNSKMVIIIANHGKPENVFIPYQEWEKENKNKSRTITFADIEKYTGSLEGGDSDSSKKIDEILYKNYKNKK